MYTRQENKYELEIISSESGKKYKTHNIDDVKTVGVYENEPFQIHFKNNTSKKVQVRISVDGTDVLTGELAHTDIEGRMWIVNPYSSMELKAWPEDDHGGAEFLFGKTKDSVAANTHGSLQGKGLIAVAVFEETYSPSEYILRPPSRFERRDCFDHTYPKGLDLKDEVICRNVSDTSQTYSANINEVSETKGVVSRKLEPGPAVGAGGYQSQTITKAARLVKPRFAETLVIKYEWWTSLRSKLRNTPEPKTAFPGDQQKNINLGNTPRKLLRQSRLRPETKYVEYVRFG